MVRSRLDRCRSSSRRTPLTGRAVRAARTGTSSGRTSAGTVATRSRLTTTARGFPCRSVMSPRAAGTRVHRIIWLSAAARSWDPSALCSCQTKPTMPSRAAVTARAVVRSSRGRSGSSPPRAPEPVGLPVGAESQHQPERGDVHGGRRTSVAQQRERHPGGRDQAEVAGDRDRDLDADQRGEPGRGERRGAAERAAAGTHDPPHEDGCGEDGQGAGEDPVLLHQAGEREVGLPAGQVERHQPVQRMLRAAGEAAPGQRDVHLQDRPAGAVGVGRAAQEGVEPLLLVGVQPVLAERQQQHGGDQEEHEHLERDPAEHQHRRGERAEDRGGGQVRLGDDESDRQGGDGQCRRQATRPRPVGAEHLGQHQHQPELGELRGLHGERAEGQPPAGAVDRRTTQVDRRQQHQAHQVAAPAQPAQAVGAPAPQQQEERHSGDIDDELVPDQRLVTESGEVGQPETGQHRHRSDGEGIEEGGNRQLRRPARPRAGPVGAQQPSFDAEHVGLALQRGAGDRHRP